MSYSAVVTHNEARPRVLQATPLACVAAATADAMGDRAHWDLNTRYRVQEVFINDLNLHTQGTTLDAMRIVGSRRFPNGWTFATKRADFAEAVWLSTQLGIVLILASAVPGQIGHAFHLLGGSYPLHDADLPSFLAVKMQRQNDFLEVVHLWDPWTGRIDRSNYGSVRARYERAGGWILGIGRRSS